MILPPKAKKETAPKLSMQEVLARLRKEDASVGTLADFDMAPVGLSTGNLTLDFLIGCDGFPEGRIVELFGPPSSGKTTSALQSMALVQRECIESGEGFVAFFDFEQSLDENYCRSLGLDVNDPTFIYVQPLYFEEGAAIFREMLDTGELRMATFDSVAAMVTEKEAEAPTGTATVADRAKMLHQFLRQIKGKCQQKKCTPIFLNHDMDKVDTTFMGQQMAARGIKVRTQPGGQALPFYASVRIAFKHADKVKTNTFDVLSGQNEKTVTSNNVTATVVKNKVGVPFRTATLRVRWGQGFSQPYSVLSVLIAHNVVKVKGAGYHHFPAELAPPNSPEGEFKVHGEDAALKAIENDPVWLVILEARAKALLAEHGVETISAEEAAALDGSAAREGLVETENGLVDSATGELV